jgi:hypothetical protein
MSVISANICNSAAYAVAAAHNAAEAGSSPDNPIATRSAERSTSQSQREILDSWPYRKGGPEFALELAAALGWLTDARFFAILPEKKRPALPAGVTVEEIASRQNSLQQGIRETWERYASKTNGRELELGDVQEFSTFGDVRKISKFDYRRALCGKFEQVQYVWLGRQIVGSSWAVNENILQNCLRHSGSRLAGVRFRAAEDSSSGKFSGAPIAVIRSGASVGLMIPRDITGTFH